MTKFNPTISTNEDDQESPQPSRHGLRYLQPAIAYVTLIILCHWAIISLPILSAAGHILGEHVFSVYNMLLVASAILMLTVAWLRRDSTIAWRVLDLSLCCFLVSQGLKQLPLSRPSGGGHGFPSGHTLTCFAVAWFLMEFFPPVSPFVYLLAVAIGWSRVEIHEHYRYQVLIGAVLGMLVGYGVTKAQSGLGVLLPRLVRRRSHRGG